MRVGCGDSTSVSLSNRRIFDLLITKAGCLLRDIRLVGGVDIAYVGNIGINAVVVLDTVTLEIVKSAVARCSVWIP